MYTGRRLRDKHNPDQHFSSVRLPGSDPLHDVRRTASRLRFSYSDSDKQHGHLYGGRQEKKGLGTAPVVAKYPPGRPPERSPEGGLSACYLLFVHCNPWVGLQVLGCTLVRVELRPKLSDPIGPPWGPLGIGTDAGFQLTGLITSLGWPDWMNLGSGGKTLHPNCIWYGAPSVAYPVEHLPSLQTQSTWTPGNIALALHA